MTIYVNASQLWDDQREMAMRNALWLRLKAARLLALPPEARRNIPTHELLHLHQRLEFSRRQLKGFVK
jgi:hypothetical protein